MIKVRNLVLVFALFVFLFSGCAQTLSNKPLSKNRSSSSSISRSKIPSQKPSPSIFSYKEERKANLQNMSGYTQVKPAFREEEKDSISLNKSEEKSKIESVNYTSIKTERQVGIEPEKNREPSKTDDINEDEYEEELSPEKTESALDEALEYCQISQDFWQKGEIENAIDALDHAYSLILNVNTSDRPGLIQQIDDLRFTISKRILEIYASRHVVVNGKHNAIPIRINQHVQAEIDLLTGRERNFFLRAYKRAGIYRPAIIEELKNAGLPVELSWLPLIESGFTVDALSPARALGLWQFIPSTGYKFGLKRDRYIDERLDPKKSTKAAIAYLKELHQIFGDWSTVLAAYNCGEGKVLKVIRDQNVNYLDNFWDLYERLPNETARYVPRFLATLHIVTHADQYGINTVTPDSPLEYETIMISRHLHLKDIAAAIGTSQNILADLNPELRHQIVPESKYMLKIPTGKKEILLSKLNEIPTASSPAPQRASSDYIYHKVKKGETLSSIARKYSTNINNIMKTNKIKRSKTVVVGKILRIPSKGMVVVSQKEYEQKKTQPKIVSKHVVKRSDSIWVIAEKYGTTAKDIRKLNNISGSSLKVGQVLKIPKNGSQQNIKEEDNNHTTQKNAAINQKDTLRIYRVRNGDVPFEIAKRHNMPLERFLRVNSLKPNSKIYPGQKLHVE